MLKRLQIKTKLLLLAGIPTLALLGVAGFGTLQMVAELRQMQVEQSLGTLVVALGEVAHELQKERGMTAGFLSSKGTKFTDRLPGQRAASDAAISTLQQALGRIHQDHLESDYRTRLGQLGDTFAGLGDWRKQASALQVTPPDSFRFYSNLIGDLLETAWRTGNQIQDAAVARLSHTKSALLYLKERNGQERALLSGAFGAGQISPAAFETLRTLLGDQATYLRIADAFASAEQSVLLRGKLDEPIVKEVTRIEQMVQEKGPNVALDYPAETWFDQITRKIDLLRSVEERFSADITNRLAADQRQAMTAVILYLSLTGATLLLTFIVGARIVRGILRQMGGEPEFAVQVAHNIAAGKLDNAIRLRQGDRDSLLASMLDMQRQLHERITSERRAAAENLRIKSALDKASTDVMVTDHAGLIIYANAACLRMLQSSESDLRSDLPDFQSDRLLGSHVGTLVRQQGEPIWQMTSPRTTEFEVGGRVFRLVANPVLDERGERLGSVLEWTDRTEEVRVQQDLAALLEAAVRGDFERRLDTQGQDGFFKQMSDGMNRLIDIVSAGLSDIARVLDSIAHGDLSQRISADYAGTFARLKDDTNSTVERLTEIASRIQEATAAINSAAHEIAAGNSDLSARTESQASSLEETASSMEQLSATVRQNAQNALQANQLARTARELIERGGERVGAVVTTMDAIQTASGKIADIISVIDSIAFQTNILALNAAVEAARAGEQGRGFAVVAAEVRMLAQRSAQAAKEIKDLIADSMSKVDTGAGLAQQAGSAMDEVIRSFQQVAQLVSEITDASREQSAGIEQVAQAVGQIDEMTQQNAALVEQAAAATESLEDQARELTSAAAIFKLDGTGVPTRPDAGTDHRPMAPGHFHLTDRRV